VVAEQARLVRIPLFITSNTYVKEHSVAHDYDEAIVPRDA